jgi:hypothetical protein
MMAPPAPSGTRFLSCSRMIPGPARPGRTPVPLSDTRPIRPEPPSPRGNASPQPNITARPTTHVAAAQSPAPPTTRATAAQSPALPTARVTAPRSPPTHARTAPGSR